MDLNIEENKKIEVSNVGAIKKDRITLDIDYRNNIAKKVLIILSEEGLSYWQAKTILEESIKLLEVECVVSV